MPPLPWKKAGISRFVADHINSAKQGGSLVETGFSTSLVDLFGKNREGLKRSSKNNKKKKNRSGRRATESLAGDSTDGDRDLDLPFLLLPSSPASSSKNLISHGSFYTTIPSPNHRMAPSPTISRAPSRPIWETSRPSFSRVPDQNESFAPDDAIRGDRKSVRAKKVFVGMLKIIFLIVLALGKKQFALGITVTAFLLHIMEFLGKCVCILLKQCQYAYFSFRHFLEQVVCNLRSKNEIIESTCSMEDDSSKEDQTDDDDDDEEEQKQEQEEANSTLIPNPLLQKGNRIARNRAGSRSFQLRSETCDNLNHCRSLHMDWISGIITDEEEKAKEEDEEEEQRDSNNKTSRNRNLKIKSKIKKLWVSKKKQEQYPISDSDEEEQQQEEVADDKSSKNMRKDIKSKINKIIPKKLKNSTNKKKQTYHKKNRPVLNENESQAIDNLYEQESCTSSNKPDDDDQILPFNDEEEQNADNVDN